jgi:CRP/FNR family transcriptional regulator
MSEQYGTPIEEGILIDVKLTHQQLANMVGTVRESVTKVLQELQDEGCIVVRKKRIILIDAEAIKRDLR